MAKNIVLCLDGTSDFAAQSPTHVFRLFCGLERSATQVIYYDGGVGTLRDAHELFWISKRIGQVLDQAAGFSVRDHFLEAYEFLCKTYEEGDRVFLFGFSRGAYTARVVAAAVNKFGITYREHLNILPYLWQNLSEVKNLDVDTNRFFNRLKGAFGQKAQIEFMGLWDTVSAFGLCKLRTIPQTAKLAAAKAVRHAVSIDEQRNMFPENLVSPEHKNLREVWFAGVHRDIGGGGKENTLGLSMFSFRWVLEEAESCGLQINPQARTKMQEVNADACVPNNYSLGLVAVFGLAGLVPMRVWNSKRNRYVWQWLNFWRVRPLPEGALVHRSVQQRIQECRIGYAPKNVDVQRIKWFDNDPPNSIADLTKGT